MLSVQKLDSETPLIVVLYHSVTKENILSGVQWLQAQMDKRGPSVEIKATELEQKLILKLLALNSKYLSNDYKPDREPAEPAYKLSFFLPVGPLSLEDIGKLNADTGCALCGRRTSSRCSQCQSVSYCGKECQRADWPSHKHTCRSLKGGTWRALPFSRTIPGME